MPETPVGGGPLSGPDLTGDPAAGSSPPGATTAVSGPRPPTRRERRLARRSRRRRRIALWSVAAVALVVALAVAALYGFLSYESHRIHRYDVKHLKPVSTTGRDKDIENILLIGSTTRCGLKEQNAAYGLCDEGVTGVNSDVVMILHLDPDHHRESILSIPRDTFVPNAHADGVNKIDAALGDPAGPSQLVAAIEEDFGIPINHYVELDFDGFAGVVEALGGIKMYFPMPVYDAESQLWQPESGCVELDGTEALSVVRARHLQYQPPSYVGDPRSQWPYDPQSDLSRIRRDHEFLRVLASAVTHRGLGNFVTDLQLINSIAPNVSADEGFSTTEMADLVWTFHDVDPDSVPQYTLPVVVDGDQGGYDYNGANYGDIVFPVEPEDRQVVAQFLGTDTDQTASGTALPSPASISVAIEDATPSGDAGSEAAASLEALGYRVVSVSDAPEPADITETSVLYSSPLALDDASQVDSAFTGLSVMGYDPGLVDPDTPGTIDVGTALPPSVSADVVVVLGTNDAIVSPSAGGGAPSTARATSPTTAAPGSPTTTTTEAPELADNPDLAPPSPAVEPLEPWDPRSCTASGGPGP